MSETSTTNPPRPPQQAAALLFIHAQTGLHPGSGTALGTVDLPIQRERHTQWPVIPGSTLKGILRDAIREKVKGNYQPEYEVKEENGQTRQVLKRSQRRVANEDDADLVAAFGPGKVEQDTSHAGALSLTDARILAFPVRSLKGVFAWVTCPAVLQRFNRDLDLIQSLGTDLTPKVITDVPQLSEEEQFAAFNSDKHPLLVDGNKLVLEEYEFTRVPSGGVGESLLRAVESAVHELSRASVKDHLVVLHNTWFTHFARHATEVVARIALDYERKTVKGTALFYEEFLPAETLFYSVALASASRREGYRKSAPDILGYLRQNMPSVLQIGGDETIGKGLCAVRLDAGKDGA